MSAAGRIIFLVRSSTTNKIEGDTPAYVWPAPSESSKVPSSTINDLSPCPSPLIPVVGVRATVERTRVQRCSESHFCDTHVPG